MENTKSLMKKVYQESGKKLNIFALVGRIKKETYYELPEVLIDQICEYYLAHKEEIHNPYAYFIKVLKLKRDENYVSLQQKREKEFKGKVNATLLKELFK